MLGGDIGVAELAGAPGGVGDGGEQLAVGLRRRDGRALDAGQPGELALGAVAQRGGVGLDARQQIHDVLVVLPGQQREQQMRGRHVRMPGGDRPLVGGSQRFPALVGQLGVHGLVLLLVRGVLLLLQLPTYDKLSLFHSRLLVRVNGDERPFAADIAR